MTTTTAAHAVTAALVQGLHAFMASEAKAAATDTQLEVAAKATNGPGGLPPTMNHLPGCSYQP